MRKVKTPQQYKSIPVSTVTFHTGDRQPREIIQKRMVNFMQGVLESYIQDRKNVVNTDKRIFIELVKEHGLTSLQRVTEEMEKDLVQKRRISHNPKYQTYHVSNNRFGWSYGNEEQMDENEQNHKDKRYKGYYIKQFKTQPRSVLQKKETSQYEGSIEKFINNLDFDQDNDMMFSGTQSILNLKRRNTNDENENYEYNGENANYQYNEEIENNQDQQNLKTDKSGQKYKKQNNQSPQNKQQLNNKNYVKGKAQKDEPNLKKSQSKGSDELRKIDSQQTSKQSSRDMGRSKPHNAQKKISLFKKSSFGEKTIGRENTDQQNVDLHDDRVESGRKTQQNAELRKDSMRQSKYLLKEYKNQRDFDQKDQQIRGTQKSIDQSQTNQSYASQSQLRSYNHFQSASRIDDHEDDRDSQALNTKQSDSSYTQQRYSRKQITSNNSDDTSQGYQDGRDIRIVIKGESSSRIEEQHYQMSRIKSDTVINESRSFRDRSSYGDIMPDYKSDEYIRGSSAKKKLKKMKQVSSDNQIRMDEESEQYGQTQTNQMNLNNTKIVEQEEEDSPSHRKKKKQTRKTQESDGMQTSQHGNIIKPSKFSSSKQSQQIQQQYSSNPNKKKLSQNDNQYNNNNVDNHSQADSQGKDKRATREARQSIARPSIMQTLQQPKKYQGSILNNLAQNQYIRSKESRASFNGSKSKSISSEGTNEYEEKSQIYQNQNQNQNQNQTHKQRQTEKKSLQANYRTQPREKTKDPVQLQRDIDDQNRQKEIEFLKIQKQEIEKSLLTKYSIENANNINEKRTIISDLIQQLELEKVPEIKYQIYLYKERMSQIKHLKHQVQETMQARFEGQPDCYEYMNTIFDQKFKNKVRKDEQQSLKFSDNIKALNHKTHGSVATYTVQNADIQEHTHQNMNITDRQADKDNEFKRKAFFKEESKALQDLRQLQSQDGQIVQAEIDEKQNDQIWLMKKSTRRFNKNLEIEDVSDSDELIKPKTSQSQKSPFLEEKRQLLSRLSRERMGKLQSKFKKIQDIANIKQQNILKNEIKLPNLLY